MRRVLTTIFAGLVLIVLAVLALAGWRFADTILIPRPYGLLPEFEIVATGEERVTLPLLADPPQFGDARQTGVFNLLYEGGYGRLGPILAEGDGEVVRRFELLAGRPPQSGDSARLDNFLFLGGPEERGVEVEEVILDGEVGRLLAWWADRGSTTAVLALHGRRRGEAVETLRLAPTLLAEDRSLLVLAYRNHRGSDPSPDGFYHYGASEYRDVLTAAAFLRERGVERVILVGLSLGGALALEALERWPEDAPEPVGLVLDSPLLDPRTVFRVGARDMDLPLTDLLTDVAMFVARLRSGIVWNDLDQVRDADGITVPVLLIAGTEDGTIPISLMDEFAARVTAPLVYHRVEGADHVEGWNLDPARYEGWVREFLDGL